MFRHNQLEFVIRAIWYLPVCFDNFNLPPGVSDVSQNYSLECETEENMYNLKIKNVWGLGEKQARISISTYMKILDFKI